MPADRPEEFKGWPKSWYDEKGDLRCPAVGCPIVFRTVEEVKEFTKHFFLPMDDDMNFHHALLVAMSKVQKCLKCPYTPFPPGKPLGIIGTRDLFKHEREVHHSEDLSDFKKFIGLIREKRYEEFGGGLTIWPQLRKYHIRNIQKQPEYHEFKGYVMEQYPIFRPRIADWNLVHLAKADRRGIFPPCREQDKEKYEEYYPVTSKEFLESLERLETQQEGVTVERYERGKELLKVMRDKYSRGEF
uniref:Uncharacterized protein n=1 Tax=Cladonia uncialis subsp. uncialis TaxID=180999 RepID=A0A2K9YDZ3_CLAUC|nr:hypothetical protein [Cladonia uncialis subsp. uncialis]